MFLMSTHLEIAPVFFIRSLSAYMMKSRQ